MKILRKLKLHDENLFTHTHTIAQLKWTTCFQWYALLHKVGWGLTALSAQKRPYHACEWYL